MEIKLSLLIDGSEVNRRYRADEITDIDWQMAVESMAESVLTKSKI